MRSQSPLLAATYRSAMAAARGARGRARAEVVVGLHASACPERPGCVCRGLCGTTTAVPGSRGRPAGRRRRPPSARLRSGCRLPVRGIMHRASASCSCSCSYE